MVINFENLYRFKLFNSNKEINQKYEIVKLLLQIKILERYKKKKRFLKIYTEFPTTQDSVADLYVENINSKSVTIYKIKNRLNEEKKQQIVYKYRDFKVPFTKTFNLMFIDLSFLSSDIEELNKQLNNYIL